MVLSLASKSSFKSFSSNLADIFCSVRSCWFTNSSLKHTVRYESYQSAHSCRLCEFFTCCMSIGRVGEVGERIGGRENRWEGGEVGERIGGREDRWEEAEVGERRGGREDRWERE